MPQETHRRRYRGCLRVHFPCSMSPCTTTAEDSDTLEDRLDSSQWRVTVLQGYRRLLHELQGRVDLLGAVLKDSCVVHQSSGRAATIAGYISAQLHCTLEGRQALSWIYDCQHITKHLLHTKYSLSKCRVALSTETPTNTFTNIPPGRRVRNSSAAQSEGIDTTLQQWPLTMTVAGLPYRRFCCTA